MSTDQARYTVGIHAVRHVLQSDHPIVELYIEKGKSHPRINELVHLAKGRKINVRFMPPEAMARMAGQASHQGAIARLAEAGRRASLSFNHWLETFDAETCRVLLLDQITDPHNLGACLRTAEAAGCHAVIIPRNHAADLHSPVVSKTACGAVSRLAVLQVSNLGRSIKALQDHGFWVYGLAGEGSECLFDTQFPQRSAIVMGAEGSGLRRMVREHCDALLHIPMPGSMESLNVSVATGITLFEIVRQQR